MIKSEAKGHFALFKQLLRGLIHLYAREVVDSKVVDNLPVATGTDHKREGVHDALGDAVRVSVADHSHVAPVVADSAEPEVVDVITSSSSG